MKIIKNNISILELKEMAEKMFGSLVKAMVDVEKRIIAVDAPLHSDLMDFLMEEEGSEPKNLWGINIHPDLPAQAGKTGEDFIAEDSAERESGATGSRSNDAGNTGLMPFIEFDSMMNLKPALGNRTRGVEDGDTRKKIIEIITKLVVK